MKKPATPAPGGPAPAKRTYHARQWGETIQVLCKEDGRPLVGLFLVWKLDHAVFHDMPNDVNQKIFKAAGLVDADDRRLVWKYALAVTDRNGFLQPVLDGRNPWYDIYCQLVPHAFRWVQAQQVKACAVRHPNPKVARALTAFLNKDESAPQEQKKLWDWFMKWEEQAEGYSNAKDRKLARRLELVRRGQQLVLEFDENPDLFWPRGSDLYDGWLLFDGMPHQDCDVVAEKVRALKAHLAALRYPVGENARPYRGLNERPKDLGKGEHPLRQLFDTSRPHPIQQTFDARTAACVARFQDHVKDARELFVVAPSVRKYAHDAIVKADEKFTPLPPSQAHSDAEEYAFLIGTAYDTLEAVKKFWASRDKRPTSLERSHPGCVDHDTGDAMEAWLAAGVRKPGKILLPTDSEPGGSSVPEIERCWLREDTIVQLEAWRMLAGAFGCTYGYPYLETWPNLALRSVLDLRAGAGRSVSSLHKAGLAIDLLSGSAEEAPRQRPVRIEARDVPGAETLRFRWVAFGHSSLDVFAGDDQAARDALAASLDGFRAKLIEKLKARFGDKNAAAAMTWILRTALAYANAGPGELNAPADGKSRPLASAEVLASRVRNDWKAFKNAYFRETVRPFIFSAAHKEGGTISPKSVKPSDGDHGIDPANSFFNLTALAHWCYMESIFTARNDYQESSCSRLSNTFQVGENLQEVYELIRAMMTKPSKDRPSPFEEEKKQLTKAGLWESSEWIVIGGSGEPRERILPDTVRLDFFKAWLGALAEWKKAAEKAAGRLFVESPPQVVVALGETATQPGFDPWKDVVRALRSKFGAHKVRVLRVGEGLTGKDDSDVQVSLTAKALSGKDLADLMDGVKVREPPEPPPEGERPTASAAEGANVPVTGWSTDQCSITIQPLLDQKSEREADATKVLFQPTDKATILMVGDNESPREWWHFQSGGDVYKKPWSDLMDAIGFSPRVLAAPMIPNEKEDGEEVGTGMGHPKNASGLKNEGVSMAPDAKKPFEDLEQYTAEPPPAAPAGS